MIMPDDPELGDSPQRAAVDSAPRIGVFIASPAYWLTKDSPADVLARRVAQLAPHLRASAYDEGTVFEARYHRDDLGEDAPNISFEFDLDPPDDLYNFRDEVWRLTACSGDISVVFILPCRQSPPTDLTWVVAALQAIRALPQDPVRVDPSTLSPLSAN